MKSEIDVSEFVKLAEMIKKGSPEINVLCLYCLMAEAPDSMLTRWVNILLKYGIKIDNVVPCILTLFEDMLLSQEG